MELDRFTQDVIEDRLEGWELIEFLQIPIDQILLAALENDWIDEDNLDDVREFVGLKN